MYEVDDGRSSQPETNSGLHVKRREGGEGEMLMQLDNPDSHGQKRILPASHTCVLLLDQLYHTKSFRV